MSLLFISLARPSVMTLPTRERLNDFLNSDFAQVSWLFASFFPPLYHCLLHSDNQVPRTQHFEMLIPMSALSWYLVRVSSELPILNHLVYSLRGHTVSWGIWENELRQLLLRCTWLLSHVWLFATPWTIAHQAPLSMGLLQARILEWVAMPSSRGSSQPTDWTQVSRTAGRFFTIWATREAQHLCELKELRSNCKAGVEVTGSVHRQVAVSIGQL